MTDKELLEAAARAAGYTPTTSDNGEFVVFEALEPRDWNPLIDDGDAFRLAVKLGITIAPFPVGARVRFQNHILDTCEVEVSGDDPYAATRRAIVRAAAEIGNAMP